MCKPQFLFILIYIDGYSYKIYSGEHLCVYMYRQGRRYEAFVWDASVLQKPEKKGKTNGTYSKHV